MKAIAAVGLSLLVAAAAPARGAAGIGQWTRTSAEAPLPGVEGILETVWTAPRPPGGPYDTIELHRYRADGPRKAALLYLPGTNMNGEVAVRDEGHNLWLYLAHRGVEVYALDYRTRQVPPDGVDDFRFMGVWSMRAFTDDARAAATLALHESGRPGVFVAGFSRGVSLAWALASSEPSVSLAGLIALDGTFKHHAPKGELDFESAHEAFQEKGEFASDVAAGIGWETRAGLMAAVTADPGAPSDEPGQTRGQHLARLLYDAWGSIFGPGALANAVDGVSRPEILAALLEGYDRYYPALQNLEGRVLADHADAPYTAIDDGWGELSLPVLYFGSTRMGGEWLLNGIYTAVASGSPDVTIHVLENHGHLDVLVGERAPELVFAPALDWIVAHGGGDSP